MSKIKKRKIKIVVNDSKASIKRIKWLWIGYGISWFIFGIIILIVTDEQLALFFNPGYVMTESDPIYLLMKFYSDTFIIVNLGPLFLVVIILCISKLENYHRPMLEAFYAGLFAGFLIEPMKSIINRIRPFQEGSLIKDQINTFGETTDTGSMPSGHVGYTGATLLPHSIRLKSIIIVVVIVLYNAGMMYARLFLGVNYASDVLVGNIISLLCATFAFFMFEKIYKRI